MVNPADSGVLTDCGSMREHKALQARAGTATQAIQTSVDTRLHTSTGFSYSATPGHLAISPHIVPVQLHS